MNSCQSAPSLCLFVTQVYDPQVQRDRFVKLFHSKTAYNTELKPPNVNICMIE